MIQIHDDIKKEIKNYIIFKPNNKKRKRLPQEHKCTSIIFKVIICSSK